MCKVRCWRCLFGNKIPISLGRCSDSFSVCMTGGCRAHGVGCRAYGAGCRAQGVGCRTQVAGCRTQCAGCRVQGVGCRVQGVRCRVQGAGCRVQGAGFWVQGAGFRAQGARCGEPDRWGDRSGSERSHSVVAQHLPPVEGRYKATWRGEGKLPWREAGPPSHLDDNVDSDQ